MIKDGTSKEGCQASIYPSMELYLGHEAWNDSMKYGAFEVQRFPCHTPYTLLPCRFNHTLLEFLLNQTHGTK
jgi:hypothetical protein